jgi:hypothetical protein
LAAPGYRGPRHLLRYWLPCFPLLKRNRLRATSDRLKTEFIGRRNHREKPMSSRDSAADATPKPESWTKGRNGSRSATHVQRLWAVLHVYSRGSGVLPRSRLFGAQALQNMPPSQEERTVGRRRRIPAQFIPEHKRDLFRVWTADHGSIRAPRGSSCVLSELLPEPEDQLRWG